MINAFTVGSSIGLSDGQLGGLDSLGGRSLAIFLQILHQALQLIVEFVRLHLQPDLKLKLEPIRRLQAA